MIAGGNHTIIQLPLPHRKTIALLRLCHQPRPPLSLRGGKADVAIPRYDPPNCTVETDLAPGDCQEVNCPKGAREATLGCGLRPRNDTENGTWFHLFVILSGAQRSRRIRFPGKRERIPPRGYALVGMTGKRKCGTSLQGPASSTVLLCRSSFW